MVQPVEVNVDPIQSPGEPIRSDQVVVVQKKPFYEFVKRTFDIFVAVICLLVGLPVYLILVLAIVIDDPGNPIFVQERIGIHGGVFRMVKFRSMMTNAESQIERMTEAQREEFMREFKLKDDPRITRVGKFIRKTSLDELPQLVNVLKGDMSLVGPRPPLLIERDAYGGHLERVMSVRPGLTGYWQVHGRSDTEFQERIEMNEYYIAHRSIGMDVKILFDTVGVVLSGKGAN